MENETLITDRYKEIMNRALRVAVYIVLASFSFSLGYRVGMMSRPSPVAAVDEAVMNTDTEVMTEIWYEVCIEGNRLAMYRVDDTETTLLASEEISAQVFPYEDRSQLQSGLKFTTFEAAQASFEDFVS